MQATPWAKERRYSPRRASRSTDQTSRGCERSKPSTPQPLFLYSSCRYTRPIRIQKTFSNTTFLIGPDDKASRLLLRSRRSRETGNISKAKLIFSPKTGKLFSNTLRGGSRRSTLTRRLLCSAKHLTCQERAPGTCLVRPFNFRRNLLTQTRYPDPHLSASQSLQMLPRPPHQS